MTAIPAEASRRSRGVGSPRRVHLAATCSEAITAASTALTSPASTIAGAKCLYGPGGAQR